MNIVTRTSKGGLITHQEQDSNLLQLKQGVEEAQQLAKDNSILAQFVGAVKAQIGVQRYYHRADILINSIFAYLSDVAVTDVVAQVRVNGVVVKTITITEGNDSVTEAANISVPEGSYLTVDIVSGTGNNLSLRFDR